MAGRKKLQPAQTGTDIQISDKTPEAIALQEVTWRQADEEAVARAATVAKELLYEEELSIGALEDGIRLYQRRVVEDFLELGKRLLLLKELTPHGEFGQRTAALGFAQHAAQRFMRAAAKAAKSDKLSLLAGKVKNPAVFVELIALDDDTLEEFADMDDIESLSAPEARRRIRELHIKLEKEAAAKSKAITAASETSARLQKLQLTLPQRNPDAVLRDMLRELGGRVRDMQEATSALVDGIDTITRHADENGLTVDDDMGATVVNAIRSLIGFIADLKTLRGIDAPARFIAVVLPDIGEPS